MPDNNFPLTLAEVLYDEVFSERYGDRDQSAESTAEVSAQQATSRDASNAARNGSVEPAADSIETYVAKIKTDLKELAKEKDWDKRKKASDRIVSTIYQAIHFGAQSPLKPNKPLQPAEPRSALCLSGGGIRSAIFNLGVLQGLAHCGLLTKFDYLSTVSGGGYIASWLTRWIHSSNLTTVAEELKNPPASPLAPEPRPVYNLRVFSNFLTPKTGVLSPDTWTMIATYLRNLFLNWLVFIPAIMTFLMLPRLWISLWIGATKYSPPTDDARIPVIVGIAGLICGLISLTGITLNLPTAFNRNWRVKWILLICIVPLSLMAVCFSLYWAMVRHVPDDSATYGWLYSFLSGKRPTWHVFAIAGAVIPAFPQMALSLGSLLKLVPKFSKKDSESPTLFWQIASCVLVPVLVAAGGALTGLLTYAIVGIKYGLLVRLSNVIRFGNEVLDPDSLLYVSLSVPFLLFVFMIGGTIAAGFSSRFSFSEDQEWWARCGAWTLMVVLAWGGLTLLVTFGPLLLMDPRNLIHGHTDSIKSTVASIAGVVSGVISLVGGFSSSTKGNGKEDGASAKTQVFSVVTSVAAAIFALYLAIILIWASDWLLFGLAKALETLGLEFSRVIKPGNHQWFINASPWLLEVLAIAGLVFLTLAMGWCINTNRFSLHYWWRNRMMRSMLGTTRDETERESSRTKFTDFDNEDNVPMKELRQGPDLPLHELAQKPFHVLNATLNLVGGDKLEWQDRKAESFTMSPLHCGSYWLGYRKSKEYGGPDGITLATAASISGAAASPNMGYMMTSSIVRIIMTLFNVRLGFWLGNPGPAGKNTYILDSPNQSVRPIVEEALGLTDDKKPYVYLSDGGHFENFGLYEMVLRRCRFILVCDAGSDAGYEFGDLAMAIRQIRVDFGVPIDMSQMIFGRDPNTGNNYCALGVIRYSYVDSPDGSTNPKWDAKYDGLLIYVKPSLNGDEPRDVLNYHETSETFPQESSADQWFSEAQFESYRALGRHMIETIRDAMTDPRKHIVDTENTGQRPTSRLPDKEEETEPSESKAAFAYVAPELEDRIGEVIKALNTSNDRAPGCCEYAGFAARARAHVGRHVH